MGVQYNTIENVPVASFETSWKNESANQPIKSVVAEITPTQDLHGYDYPWPAGGGKNLLDSTSYSRLQNCTIVDGVVTATVSDTRQQIWPVCQLYDGTEYVRGTERIGESFSWRFTKTNDVNVIAFGHTGASKDIKIYYPIAHLKDGMEYVFSANVISAIEPFSWDSMMICNSTADYNTFTPYSNICPITGRTEATVTRAGKNLLADTNFRDSFVVNNVTFTRVSGGHYKASGTCSSATWLLIMSSAVNKHNIPVSLPTGTYTLSCENPKVYCYIYRGDGYSDYVNRRGSITSENMPVTGVRYLIGAGVTFDDDDIYFQLNKGTAATPYTPYSGTSYPVSWQTEAGEVYGGTVDVVSGTLTVDKAEIVFNGSENWTPYGKEGYYLPLNTMEKKLQNYEGAILCDTLPTFRSIYVKDYQDAAYGITGWSNTSSAGNNYIYIKGGETVATSSGTIKAWLAENPIQVVYALATPQTYQLSGQQIKTLLGVNNVWADSGNIKKLMWQYTIFDLLRVFINGFEITDFIAFGGWQRERGDVDGPEAGRTLDARMHRARVATKMRYNVTCRPLLVEELSSLERLIMPEYVTVKVIGDPYYGTWEKTCYVNNTSSQYLIRKRNGAQWWGGITFPIIEV